MQSNTTTKSNESFKLLNLSDDDKSSELPDLDLPEISLQRKRKVKRKARSRTPSKHLHNEQEGPFFRCKNFGLWTAVLMICSWLLIVSYISSVVHAEYRRLEVELQKVSATSQHVPEALQKWHETSKILEQNQTFLFEHLVDLRKAIDTVNTEISQLKEAVGQKNSVSQESQFQSLETNIATFGSKIKDFSGQIEKLTSDYSQLKEQQKSFNDTVLDIKHSLDNSRNLSIQGNGMAADNETKSKLDALSKAVDIRFSNLSQNVSTENEYLKKRLDWLEGDLKNKTSKLGDLSDSYLNISSKVISVENLYTSDLSKQFDSINSASASLSSSLTAVQNECKSYHAEYETLAKTVMEMKKQLDDTSKMAASQRSENVIVPPNDKLKKIFSSDQVSDNNNNNFQSSNNNDNTKEPEPVIQKLKDNSSDKSSINTNVTPASLQTNTTFPSGLVQN